MLGYLLKTIGHIYSMSCLYAGGGPIQEGVSPKHCITPSTKWEQVKVRLEFWSEWTVSSSLNQNVNSETVSIDLCYETIQKKEICVLWRFIVEFLICSEFSPVMVIGHQYEVVDVYFLNWSSVYFHTVSRNSIFSGNKKSHKK